MKRGPFSSSVLIAITCALAGAAGGCVGRIGTSDDSITSSAVSAIRIRRLTALEIGNTVADLFGDGAAAMASGLEPDSRAQGFSTGDERGVTSSYVDALKTVAEGVAASFRATIAQPLFAASCFASDAGARTCADGFVRDYGKRAYRRPLGAADVTALLAVYDAGRETGVDGDAGDRFRSGLDYVVRALLQSPDFIFDIDFDKPEWNKSTAAYPLYSTALKDAFRQETALFIDDWVTSGATLDALLTRTDSFVNATSAPFYCVTVAGSAFQKTALDPTQRSGILTLPGFLGSHAHADMSSPVFRGLAILDKLLCRSRPPVPAMVPPLSPVDLTATQTTRQRFAAHTSSALCAGCHTVFEPMGDAFESYDGMGGFRTQENGAPVDSSGAIVGTATGDVPVANAIELTHALADSPEVHACFARQLFRFDVGRPDTDGDADAITQQVAAFVASGLDMRELLVAIVASPAFALRSVP
jgi:hypothetical protein